MESFIVRIYRRGKKQSRNVLGVVETMGSTEKLAFTNHDELWDILNRGNGRLKKSNGEGSVGDKGRGKVRSR